MAEATANDSAQTVIRKQRTALEKLKHTNELLKLELSLESRNSKLAGSVSATKQISRLQDQGDHYTRKIEMEKRRIEDLDRRVNMVQARILEQRQKAGGVNASKENAQLVAKQIRILENRLDKALVKFNASIASNKALRQGIDNLRRERVVFDGIYKKLERELHEQKREMAAIIEESNRAFEAQEKARAEMVSLRAQAEREQSEFETEWRELGRIIESERRQRELLTLSAAEQTVEVEHLGNLTMEEEARLKKKVARSAWGIAKDKAQIHLSHEKVASYEEAFRKIQEQTGVSDIDELVNKFIEAEDKNFSLFNFVNELNSEIERLELAITDVRAEIEKYKGQGVNSDNQRKKILRDLEERLARTEGKADEYEEKHQGAMKTINQLKTGIHSIFSRIGCASTSVEEMLGNQGVTESNMMQYLGIIEQRTSEILQLYAASQGGPAAPDQTPVPASVSLLAAPTPIVSAEQRRLVVQPPTWEDLSSGEDSSVEDDERPLTREELTRKTLRGLDKKEKRKKRAQAHRMMEASGAGSAASAPSEQ